METLTDYATGGTWASSNTAAATIDANGLMTCVANGTSTISYSLTNGCGTTTQTLDVAVYCPLGVNNIAIEHNVTVFPNPVSDMVYIKGCNPALVRVVNMYGQTVKQAESANSIEVSALPAGVYFVQVYNANGVMVDNEQILKF